MMRSIVAGGEGWLSVWSAKEDESAITAVDDKTRMPKQVIKYPEIVTPTGRFNIGNDVD